MTIMGYVLLFYVLPMLVGLLGIKIDIRKNPRDYDDDLIVCLSCFSIIPVLNMIVMAIALCRSVTQSILKVMKGS